MSGVWFHVAVTRGLNRWFLFGAAVAVAGAVVGVLTGDVAVFVALWTAGGLVGMAALTQRQTRSVHRKITAGVRELEHAVSRVATTVTAPASKASAPAPKVDPVPTVGTSGGGARTSGTGLPFTDLPGELRSVTLVMDTFTPTQWFAGVKTALLAGALVAQRLGLPLRVAAMNDSPADVGELVSAAALVLEAEGYRDVVEGLQVLYPRSPGARPRLDDIVIVTFWKTAAAIGALAEQGLIDVDRVIYLVQDFEPGFYPWGGPFVEALNTYSLGFRMVVNSAPLATYLYEQTRVAVPADRVFAPRVEADRLAAAARHWGGGDPRRPRLLFYARPSKPRNLYGLGAAALRQWVQGLPDGVTPRILVAGENGAGLDVGPGAEVVLLGQLTHGQYFQLLSEIDMGLALMCSPHPSHLALEMPMAGVPTITNAFATVREPWVANLHVVPPTPTAISRALSDVWNTSARSMTRHLPQPLPDALGRPLPLVLNALLAELSSSS